jgi:hypothetical protein
MFSDGKKTSGPGALARRVAGAAGYGVTSNTTS